MLSTRKYLFGTTILAGVLAMAAPAFAQTAPAQTPPATTPQDDEEEEAVVEEIVVTGSRISRPQYEGTIPGVQVGEQDIEERLFTNAGDILNDVPLVGGGANLNGTNGGQTASLGVTFIDLLNLGTARTLTLVNGRRFVSNNSATIFVSGNETGSQVDASTIPVALISRVDILTVGGAATYGADAVSGVVNYVLKDDYEGAEITVIGGQTFEYEDAGRFSVNATAGRNFLDDKLNVAVSGEYSYTDSFLAADRDYRADGPGFLGNPLNGALRNPAFVPLGTQPVFLGAASDNIIGSVPVSRVRGNQTGFGGNIFNVTNNNGLAELPLIANLPTGSAIALGTGQFQPGNVFRNPGFAQISPFQFSFQQAFNLVPTTPFGACIASATDVCQLAPASITAAQAAAVRARYGLPATATDAQALAVLQANRPTAREYYAANPNTPVNAFIGTFVPGLPDIATTGALASVLPRTAVPLRFDSTGNIVTYDIAGALNTDPRAPGTSNAADNSAGTNRTDSTVLRVEQERWVGNVIANYQVTDNINFFTENLYSDIRARSPISTGGLFNGVTSSTPENAGVFVNVNHPLLTAANRTTLAAAGITGNFIVSRFNEDVVNDLSQESTNETFRTVNGFRGDFRLFDRDFGWELSHTYGKAETNVEFSAINDLAYALAIDVVNVNGTPTCRVQAVGTAAYLASYGGTPGTSQVPGAIPQIISRIGADGIREQIVFAPTITPELAAGCTPLNIFGQGRASQAARDYVSVRNFFNNESTQNFTQAILTGEVIELPAGPLQFAVSGEIRNEELSYTVDEITREGRTRSAPSATTNAEVETIEYGLELNIPLLGEGFNIPFVQALEFNPSIRYTSLEGSAETFRNLAGNIVSPSYDGETEEIYTLAATWTVNDDLLFRGNISKSVRNPSIVELFLGNQPFFTSSADPCSAANFRSGANAANRERNCIAEVRRVAGLNGGSLIAANGVNTPITNDAQATAFILNAGNSGYGFTGSAFTGLISGRQTLVPERGDSFTFGFVATPSVIPNLIVAADYLEITVEDLVGPLLAQNAAVFCYDSAVYPDNTADIGVNSCAGIQRDATFNFTNGFELPFFNLGATRVKAINANASYSMDLSDVFSSERQLGTLSFRGNAYYLLEYTTSGTGTFSDATPNENTLGNPTWRAQGTVAYSNGPFDARWTTNFQDASIVRAGINQATIDQAVVQRWPSFATHTFSVGYDITEQATARFVIDNVTDEDALGSQGLSNGTYIDTLGRRWTASLSYKF